MPYGKEYKPRGKTLQKLQRAAKARGKENILRHDSDEIDGSDEMTWEWNDHVGDKRRRAIHEASLKTSWRSWLDAASNMPKSARVSKPTMDPLLNEPEIGAEVGDADEVPLTEFHARPNNLPTMLSLAIQVGVMGEPVRPSGYQAEPPTWWRRGESEQPVMPPRIRREGDGTALAVYDERDRQEWAREKLHRAHQTRSLGEWFAAEIPRNAVDSVLQLFNEPVGPEKDWPAERIVPYERRERPAQVKTINEYQFTRSSKAYSRYNFSFGRPNRPGSSAALTNADDPLTSSSSVTSTPLKNDGVREVSLQDARLADNRLTRTNLDSLGRPPSQHPLYEMDSKVPPPPVPVASMLMNIGHYLQLNAKYLGSFALSLAESFRGIPEGKRGAFGFSSVNAEDIEDKKSDVQLSIDKVEKFILDFNHLISSLSARHIGGELIEKEKSENIINNITSDLRKNPSLKFYFSADIISLFLEKRDKEKDEKIKTMLSDMIKLFPEENEKYEKIIELLSKGRNNDLDEHLFLSLIHAISYDLGKYNPPDWALLSHTHTQIERYYLKQSPAVQEQLNNLLKALRPVLAMVSSNDVSELTSEGNRLRGDQSASTTTLSSVSESTTLMKYPAGGQEDQSSNIVDSHGSAQGLQEYNKETSQKFVRLKREEWPEVDFDNAIVKMFEDMDFPAGEISYPESWPTELIQEFEAFRHRKLSNLDLIDINLERYDVRLSDGNILGGMPSLTENDIRPNDANKEDYLNRLRSNRLDQKKRYFEILNQYKGLENNPEHDLLQISWELRTLRSNIEIYRQKVSEILYLESLHKSMMSYMETQRKYDEIKNTVSRAQIIAVHDFMDQAGNGKRYGLDSSSSDAQFLEARTKIMDNTSGNSDDREALFELEANYWHLFETTEEANSDLTTSNVLADVSMEPTNSYKSYDLEFISNSYMNALEERDFPPETVHGFKSSKSMDYDSKKFDEQFTKYENHSLESESKINAKRSLLSRGLSSTDLNSKPRACYEFKAQFAYRSGQMRRRISGKVRIVNKYDRRAGNILLTQADGGDWLIIAQLDKGVTVTKITREDANSIKNKITKKSNPIQFIIQAMGLSNRVSEKKSTLELKDHAIGDASLLERVNDLERDRLRLWVKFYETALREKSPLRSLCPPWLDTIIRSINNGRDKPSLADLGTAIQEGLVDFFGFFFGSLQALKKGKDAAAVVMRLAANRGLSSGAIWRKIIPAFLRRAAPGIILETGEIFSPLVSLSRQGFHLASKMWSRRLEDRLSSASRRHSSAPQALPNRKTKSEDDNGQTYRAPNRDRFEDDPDYPTREKHPNISEKELLTMQRNFKRMRRAKMHPDRLSGEMEVKEVIDYGGGTSLKFCVVDTLKANGVEYRLGYVDLPKNINAPVGEDNTAVFRLFSACKKGRMPIDSDSRSTVLTAHGLHPFVKKNGRALNQPLMTKIPSDVTLELSAQYGKLTLDPGIVNYATRHHNINLHTGINVIGRNGEIIPYELRRKKTTAPEAASHSVESGDLKFEKDRFTHTGIGRVDGSGAVEIHDMKISYYETDVTSKNNRAIRLNAEENIDNKIDILSILPKSPGILYLSDAQKTLRDLRKKIGSGRTHLKVIACRELSSERGAGSFSRENLDGRTRESLAHRFNIDRKRLDTLLSARDGSLENAEYKSTFSYSVIERGDPNFARDRRDAGSSDSRRYQIEFDMVLVELEIDINTGKSRERALGYIVDVSPEQFVVVQFGGAVESTPLSGMHDNTSYPSPGEYVVQIGPDVHSTSAVPESGGDTRRVEEEKFQRSDWTLNVGTQTALDNKRGDVFADKAVIFTVESTAKNPVKTSEVYTFASSSISRYRWAGEIARLVNERNIGFKLGEISEDGIKSLNSQYRNRIWVKADAVGNALYNVTWSVAGSSTNSPT